MAAEISPSLGIGAPAEFACEAGNRPAATRGLPQSDPILLLSACPRSGSNYLEALLALHPGCGKSRFPEDFFVANSATLLGYCQSVADSWDGWWRQQLGGAEELAAYLGTALLRFAEPGEGRAEGSRLLLRSPTAEGLEGLAALFPRGQVLLLVRDGPATVESGRRSFHWPYDEAMREWRNSVRRALAGVASLGPQSCRLVRFEDLAADPAQEMAEIIGFLGLDPLTYPSARIDAVPVLGSSSFGRENDEMVHWRPVAREAAFDPVGRAQSWPRWRRKRFAWIAGPEAAALGYRTQPLRWYDGVWNLLLDMIFGVARGIIQLALTPLRAPMIFSDRRRRYLSWRRMTRPGDAVIFALSRWRRPTAKGPAQPTGDAR